MSREILNNFAKAHIKKCNIVTSNRHSYIRGENKMSILSAVILGTSFIICSMIVSVGLNNLGVNIAKGLVTMERIRQNISK